MNATQPFLILNGVGYTSDRLRSGSFESNLNPFEETTLRFCHEWLNQKQDFQLHTSGSTSIPKKIAITRKQMEVSASLTINALNLKPNYTALVCLDTKYIAGQMMLVRSLLLGMNVIAVDPTPNPFEIITSIQSIDFVALVPYQLQTILGSSSASSFERVKYAIIGGAPLSDIIRKKLPPSGCRFYATYGMTETISHIALQPLNGENQTDYFSVLNDIKIGKDERGCLFIQADYLSSEKIVTNDLVEIITDKKFRWLGRWDNIINSGGIKIVPDKVELAVAEVFASLGLPNQFFIAGLPDDSLSQKVTLVIEGMSFHEDLKTKILIELKSKVGQYELPKEIKFARNFELTETGKIRRAETLNLIPASSH